MGHGLVWGFNNLLEKAQKFSAESQKKSKKSREKVKQFLKNKKSRIKKKNISKFQNFTFWNWLSEFTDVHVFSWICLKINFNNFLANHRFFLFRNLLVFSRKFLTFWQKFSTPFFSFSNVPLVSWGFSSYRLNNCFKSRFKICFHKMLHLST